MTAPSEDPEAGVANALGQLSEQTRLLVRQELDAARSEMADKARQAAPGLALAAIAAGSGVVCVASAYRLALRILERRLPPVAAALLATVASGSTAAAAAVAATRSLRRAPAPYPVETARATARAVADVAG